MGVNFEVYQGAVNKNDNRLRIQYGGHDIFVSINVFLTLCRRGGTRLASSKFSFSPFKRYEIVK